MSSLNEILVENKMISRDKWECKKYIQLKDNKIKRFELQPDMSFKESHWDKRDEDLLANDWKVLDEDDISFIELSVKDLKKYGLSEEIINDIKPKCCVNILESININDLLRKDKNIPLLQNPILNNVVQPYINFTAPQVPIFNK